MNALRHAAHHEADQAQRIAARVEQHAAAELGLHADVRVRIRHREAETRLHAAHGTDRAFAEQRHHRGGLRLEVIRKRFEQHHAVLVGGIEHALCFVAIQRERLLAEDVLPRSPDRPFGMQAVRQRNVDGVDIVAFEQRVVAAEPCADAVRLRESLCVFIAAARDCDDFHAFAGFDVARELPGNVGAAEDAEAQKHCLGRGQDGSLRNCGRSVD